MTYHVNTYINRGYCNDTPAICSQEFVKGEGEQNI